MRYFVVAVGKARPPYDDDLAHYARLLSRYARVDVVEVAGTSLDKVVWANWSLRDPAEFDTFSEEWMKWFPEEAPVGQGTLMPLLQRRAGFRISIGVIAEA